MRKYSLGHYLCLVSLVIACVKLREVDGEKKSIKMEEPEGRAFWRLPSAAFLPSALVPWTVTGLLILLPFLCLAAGLQYFVSLYGPSNVYYGPDEYLQAKCNTSVTNIVLFYID